MTDGAALDRNKEILKMEYDSHHSFLKHETMSWVIDELFIYCDGEMNGRGLFVSLGKAVIWWWAQTEN